MLKNLEWKVGFWEPSVSYVSCSRMVLENDDNAEEIKRKLAVRLLVPAINIHIIFNKTELR